MPKHLLQTMRTILAGLCLALAGAGQSAPAAAAPAAAAPPDYAYAALTTSLQRLQRSLQANPPQHLHASHRARQIYQDAQAAIERNLQEAVPGLLQAAERQPRDLAAAFRLYRDLESVAQVARQVASTSRQHGRKPQAALLESDTQRLETRLGQLADYIQATAVLQQRTLLEMQQAREAAAAAARRRPRRIIINNANHPPRRTVRHRRPIRRHIQRRRPIHHPKSGTKAKPHAGATPHAPVA